MKPRYRDPRPGEVAAWLPMHAREIRSMGSPTGRGTELRVRPSPCCSHDNPGNPSLAVNDQTGMWRCFKCNTVGNWFTLTRAFGAPLPTEDRYVRDSLNLNISGIETFSSRKRRPVTGNHYPALLEYCKTRGLQPETLDAWKVSSKGQNALRWPIYAVVDGKWEIVNTRIRLCLNKETANVRDWFEIKGGPTNLLIGNHLLNLSNPTKRIYIWEGQWDAMVAWQLGLENSFSIPNGASHVDVNGYLRYIPEDWEVWLGMDMDAAGQQATESFFSQLGPERVARFILPHKDLNDWLLAKPDLTKDEVLATAKGLTTQLALAGKSQDSAYVGIKMADDDEDVKPEPIAETPWTRLNHLLGGGLFPGQTTGLLAPSGVGKTTACNQIAVWNAYNYTKVGIISLEGTRESFERKIKAPVRGMIKPEHWNDTIKNLHISRLEGTLVTWQQCLDQFDSMIMDGCKLLILDNLDFITRDNNTLKAQAYAALINQAMQNNVHTIVVWQPNKIDRTQVVNSGNQKGYSQTFQDADNYINLNVVQDFVRVEVEKTREEGVDRMINKVYLAYDRNNRCYEECENVQLNDAGSVVDGNIMGLNAIHY